MLADISVGLDDNSRRNNGDGGAMCALAYNLPLAAQLPITMDVLRAWFKFCFVGLVLFWYVVVRLGSGQLRPGLGAPLCYKQRCSSLLSKTGAMP